ncbi:MAG: Gfo/Idh/MocA family oxidoreductase [Chloroflexota bacterium]|nr:Gfo/Idh/MocA family oxidoreductase [Chloroflexota bacterium]
MIRIAMLSFWHLHAYDYARAAAEHPETEIVAVWDEDARRGRAEAEQRGVPFFEHLDEVLAQPNVDAVVVDTPTSSHREVIVAAARAGKHIFTEKVIAATLRDAEAIMRAVEHAGVAFMVSLWRSDEASTQAVKAIIDQGSLGTLTLVRVRDGHPFALPSAGSPHGRLPEQFYRREQSGGGALIDLCHPVYLTRHFLGLPERVSATFGSITGRAVEDNAVLTLRYPTGAIGVVETGYVTPSTPFSIEVHGTQGSLIYSEPGIGERSARLGAPGPSAPANEAHAGPDGKLRMLHANTTGAAPQWLVQEVQASARPKAFNQWVTHIQQGTRARANMALGIDLTAVIEAAYRSAATGQSVRIADLEHAEGVEEV